MSVGHENRDFKLASRVEFSTPAPGIVQNVRGLWTKVPVCGWVGIRSVVRRGEKAEVKAGPFTAESDLEPILARKDIARTAR